MKNRETPILKELGKELDKEGMGSRNDGYMVFCGRKYLKVYVLIWVAILQMYCYPKRHSPTGWGELA